MTSPPALSPVPPSWQYCAQGASTADPIGCRGVHVTGHACCLAHLDSSDRAVYLAGLSPGADVDHRGTTFDDPLLAALLHAVRDPITTSPHLGTARFDSATFTADARFDGTTFTTYAVFENATFTAEAGFIGATFTAHAVFGGATFIAKAWFDGATFSDDARFDHATFTGNATFSSATFTTDAMFARATFTAKAWFDRAEFTLPARFDGATFTANVRFDGARFAADARFENSTFAADAVFGGATFAADALFDHATFSADARFDCALFTADARFSDATFTAAPKLGPLACVGVLDLSRAVFGVPVVIEAAATHLSCARTRWDATAILRLRHASLDLTEAIVTQPLAITAHPTRFQDAMGHAVGESGLTGAPGVSVLSLRGVDATQLVLTDTDLSACRFFGAVHLDQLRLGGETTFARTPTGIDLRRGIPLRWTDRLALAEEHHWRAIVPGRPRLRAGWTPATPQPAPAASPPGPPALAALYRQLRKAFEDGKDEPGAADFYMGEMEMRRLVRRPGRNRAEHQLLTAYWALSGYGLRASRSLAWLGLAVAATILAMMLWGLPTEDPKPKVTGTLPAAGQTVNLTVDNGDPTLTGITHDHLTGKRAEKAVRVVLNSVVFRSSGQNLTTAGTYIEMTSRFLEPVLLTLAALAIRGRVKR
ncbi:pentapeptide repeat-containing protein [Streptomyces sp. NPDC048484]|uniref:pentapeptide repeat-containing protein n=1 Tax=Streptomyces sp. NPDC048484 TaxID=3155146 RepID=UPI003449D4CC